MTSGFLGVRVLDLRVRWFRVAGFEGLRFGGYSVMFECVCLMICF